MLRIQNLQKHYDRFQLNCSLEVAPGSVTGLVGQNGAGKSTTFKAVLGLISPDGGTVELFGKDAHSLSKEERQKTGVVLADSGFSGYLTVQETVAIQQRLYPDFDKALFVERCRRFELPLKKQIRTFSTGMKVKLKVLAATTHGASLLILDEPTAGLDVVAREEVLDMLREFMEEDERRSILISSHISSDLEGLCDDFYMIHMGEIVLHEQTDVLLSDYALLKVSDAQMAKLDRRYLLRIRRENWGYSCLTNQKQFYLENYPDLAVEQGTMDELIMMMIRGEAVGR